MERIYTILRVKSENSVGLKFPHEKLGNMKTELATQTLQIKTKEVSNMVLTFCLYQCKKIRLEFSGLQGHKTPEEVYKQNITEKIKQRNKQKK